MLEVYFIDVGQGDGVLIVTPDRRHIMIDGGYPRDKQNTGKSAADFVDWKFFEDYGQDAIDLDVMICSHNDQDHYGGLDDLLDVEQSEELDCSSVSIEEFHHAGLSWWRTPPNGKRNLGRTAISGGRAYYTDLLTTRAKAINSLKNTANPQLQGEWAKFIDKAAKASDRNGGKVRFRRLSHRTGALPGFDTGDLTIKVLAPVERNTTDGPGLQKLGGTSQNTNGHSVLLRLDYYNARVLLTGDLNKRSQQLLLDHYDGEETEFLVDVAKACHHGSEDVSFEFLAAMKPTITVISSGDNEGHDHPRPSIIGASGITGYLTVKNDEVLTPLVYSTELARSVSLGDPTRLEIPREGQSPQTVTGEQFEKTWVHFKETKSGALSAKKKQRTFDRVDVVAGQVYGLVNVRTDGKKILAATMNEADGGWQVKTVNARF